MIIFQQNNMSKKAKAAKKDLPVVMALNVRTKAKEVMLDPKPVYSVTSKGNKRYRLQGHAGDKERTKMSKMVKEEEARMYGTPKEVAAKARAAAKKSCGEKFASCLEKKKKAAARVAEMEYVADLLTRLSEEPAKPRKPRAKKAKAASPKAASPKKSAAKKGAKKGKKGAKKGAKKGSKKGSAQAAMKEWSY